MNWFAYCCDNPVSGADVTGRDTVWALSWIALGTALAYLSSVSLTQSIASRLAGAVEGIVLKTAVDLSLSYAAVFCFSMAALGVPASMTAQVSFLVLSTLMTGCGFAGMIKEAEVGAKMGNFTLASNAIKATYAYSLLLIGALVANEVEGSLDQ